MTADLVCLTLIASRQFRQELFDYLTAQSDLVSGFTASDAAGHGTTVRLLTPAERVKGHADQVLVRIVLAKPDAEQLLVRLVGERKLTAQERSVLEAILKEQGR